MKNNLTSLSYIVSRFFRIYLPGERGFSQATVASYRDTFKQLFIFCERHLKRKPEKLLVSDLSRDVINEFLQFLENEGKSIATRNQRLAAIKCFFGYIRYAFPEYLDISSSVLQIRMKKQPQSTVSYMSIGGVASVLNSPNLYSKSGYRDALILTMLYDSGARVSEITEIRVGDIRLQSPATIVLHGKGSKDRIVPLSSKSADLIDFYLKKENFKVTVDKSRFLFTNRSGAQLTRAGVAYILKKYVDMARFENPDVIPTKFSPHCMRHSKAMHLLQAGVAIIYIRDFLGHASVKTTEIYAKADGKSKRAALDLAYSAAIDNPQIPPDSWNSDDSLMKFLTDLCSD